MKTFKFLITPNYRTPCDQRMVDGLATGFRAIGHYAHALPGPISAVELAKKCAELSIDIVIQINRTRHPNAPLPSRVRYISWFQDVFPGTMTDFAESFHGSDILFVLGDPGVIGINVQLPCYVGSLVCGVDKTIFDYRSRDETNPIDFSLCGFIPSPPIIVTRDIRKDVLELFKLTPWLGARRTAAILRRIALGYYSQFRSQNAALLTMMGTVRRNYQPLRGELDIHRLAQAMREATATHHGMPPSGGSYPPGTAYSQLLRYVHRLAGGFRSRADPSHQNPVPDLRALFPFEKSINYFAREYPRLMDREALIRNIRQLSDSIELYGPGWDMHPEFRSYAKGVINTQEGLLDIYRRSRINLANNTHGLGLHSRTLECMAVGGFIFTHESPHDNKPGGMLTSFEPGVHYGAFTPENMHDEAARWLADGAKRTQVGQQAATVVYQKHCWHHRAQQIIDDLKK